MTPLAYSPADLTALRDESERLRARVAELEALVLAVKDAAWNAAIEAAAGEVEWVGPYGCDDIAARIRALKPGGKP